MLEPSPRYTEPMESFTELPVALPCLRVARGTTTSLHTGIKEHWGIGRIDEGDTEWWGSGRVRRSVPGCILLKQPGDVVRHLLHRGPTVFTAVTLPTDEVVRVIREGEAVVTPQFEPGDPRAAPFHRLLDAACSGEDRFTLEVALAEALQALVATRGVRSDHSRPVRRALAFIRERLEESISLEELATHVDLDKFHLCRAFRAQVGMPPHAYLTHLRVARAKELLTRGVRPSELAPLVGFYDQAQLTRHFRRLVGTTPARYVKSPGDPRFRGVLRPSPQP
ncbi:Transcriptional regulator, AraC family [Cystobacter fuscus DSM 2262]|uniref:Transcriptional regulator, AraC family n=1 Tax=Cystobacter fuscus (strain ATCC 25194 / DSM 2262 / NBRC 100088 / M29) TaxID=1242864 RepID=S9PA90_CYSF2|nr:AraC family transcriptional regulator [Cystobacter fuscus]EPX59167.1 Transcriptional regulator, AraC family [Cystobacter fuscus DSM 2262]